jgi:CRISPR-associated protein Cmr1
MDKISFELEVITPLFLGGADGRTPELRPPSIRGAMRFWFRAMMGGLIGNNLDQLSKLETQIFGGTREDAQASSVIIKCYPSNLQYKGYRPLPHSSVKRFPFQGFNPNQHLNVEILLRSYPQNKRPSDYMDRLTIAKEVFELSCILGGIGKRSRRGFGSIYPKDSYQQDSKSLKEFIEIKVNQIKGTFSRYAQNQGLTLTGWSSLPTFPIIHPSYTEISISQKTSSDWESLIRDIMQGIHDL